MQRRTILLASPNWKPNYWRTIRHSTRIRPSTPDHADKRHSSTRFFAARPKNLTRKISHKHISCT